jgi:hypothetical protein
MNIFQITLLEKLIFKGNSLAGSEVNQVPIEIEFASPTDSAGGKKGENSGKQDIDAPQASDDKRKKTDNTGRTQGEDITNKSKDQREDASITQPDTNLTGDTGNLDVGQTDLGASGTGAEDL